MNQRWMNDTARSLATGVISLAIFAVLIVGITKICQNGYTFCYHIYGPATSGLTQTEKISFRITKQDSMRTVARRLKEKKVIDNAYSFFIRTKLMDPKEVVLLPGEYQLYIGMSYESIINQLTQTK